MEWLKADNQYYVVHSFISESSKEKIKQLGADTNNYLLHAAKIIKSDILTNHNKLIQWLENLPLYHETTDQIYVHAGIDEEADEYWKLGTPDEYYVGKYPASFGTFHKDIIAGHIGTSTLASDPHFNGVFWDQQSHYYIDGSVETSNHIPLLRYDSEKEEYSTMMNTWMVWNINQRSASHSQIRIKDIVIDEITRHDIAILVEYKEDKEFEADIMKHGYKVFTSGRSDGQNEVLIAIRKDTTILNYDINSIDIKKTTTMNTTKMELPNFLQIELTINNQTFYIIGTRIRVGPVFEQIHALREHLDHISYNGDFICMGDFNVTQHNLKREMGNYQVIKPEYNEKLHHTEAFINNYSYFFSDKDTKTINGMNALDHIVCSEGLHMSGVKYSWDFMRKCDDIYPESIERGTTYWSIPVGYPDHAILTACLWQHL